MGKSINMEAWQIEHAQLGLSLSTKGKGHAGRDKFNGSAQDFSEKIDMRGHLCPPKKQLVKKTAKKHQPTVFQYLKKKGFRKTYVEMSAPLRTQGSTAVDTVVIVLNSFMWDNQIKRLGGNVLRWWYENTNEDEMSEAFVL